MCVSFSSSSPAFPPRNTAEGSCPILAGANPSLLTLSVMRVRQVELPHGENVLHRQPAGSDRSGSSKCLFVLFVPQCDCRSFWLAPAFRIARTETAPEAVQGQGSGTFAQSHGGGYASLRLRLQEIASFQR